MAKAGVEGATFHDARRTATSRLAQKVDVLTLAKITGHTDLKLLMSTYYSVSMDDVAGRLD
jgi:integrase